MEIKIENDYKIILQSTKKTCHIGLVLLLLYCKYTAFQIGVYDRAQYYNINIILYYIGVILPKIAFVIINEEIKSIILYTNILCSF